MNDDAEEAWFLSSFTRYKQISMFDFDYSVSHVERSDNDHLCIVGCYDYLRKDEIMEVILPPKLLVDGTHSGGIERDGDLKFERGAFATSKIFAIKAVPNERKLLSSEDNKYGVSIYDLGCEADGSIKRLHEYTCNQFVPRFSFNGIHSILMGSTCAKPLTLMDMHTGQVIQTVNLTRSTGSLLVHSLEPEFMTEYISAVCNKSTGAVQIKDTRVDKDAVTFYVSSFTECSTAAELEQLWTVASPFQANSDTTQGPNSGDVKFACVSTGGQFLAYDVRSSKRVFYSATINKSDAGPLNNLSLKVTSDFRRFSLSGYDEKVYVYDIDEHGELKLVFAHDGHKSMTNESKNIIKCHMFLKDDLLLSADDTRSLHCWQFVPNT